MTASGWVLVLGRWRSLLVRSFVLLLLEAGITASTIEESDERPFNDIVAMLVCDDVGGAQAGPVIAATDRRREDVVVVALDHVVVGEADVRLASEAGLDDLLRALRTSENSNGARTRTPPRVRETFAGGARLTSREGQVVALLIEGTPSVRIADELGISINTVRTHVQNIMSKLGVSSRLEVAGVVADNGAGGLTLPEVLH